MPQHQTFLRCSQKTATIAFILIGSLFCLAGCAQLYKLIGLTDQQTQDQLTQDQIDRQKIAEGIRLTTTEIITTAVAGLGAIATGFLAKWLGTERKITKVLITGIEAKEGGTTKQVVHAKALDAGIENQLHARVKSLT